MAEPDRIGEWSATRVDTLDSQDDLQRRAATGVAEEDQKRPSRTVAFALGLLVGFVPLVALGAALVGYLAARNDDGQTVAVDGSSIVTSEPAVVEDENVTNTVTSVSSTVAPAVLVEPGAVIDDRNLRLIGTVPPESAEAYVEELTLLAIALGILPQDETTVDDGAPAPTEVTVALPDAVHFEIGVDVMGMENAAILDVVAAYLIARGSEITVVSIAGDGADESDSLYLAQHRAEHVVDHLLDEGADWSRIAVEARGRIEPGDGIEAAGNRVDILFHVGF